MEFILRKNRYVGVIASVKSDKVKLCRVDTGSMFTVISIETVATLKKWKSAELKSYLMCRQSISLSSISGHNIDVIPCHLSNIRLCNAIIKDFYCVIPLDPSLNKNLIGIDLFSACSVRGLSGDNLFLEQLDQELYRKNFISLCNAVNPTELLDVSTSELALLELAYKSNQCLQYKDKFNLTDAEFDKEILRILYKNNISSIDMLEYIIQHESPIGRDPM